MHSMGARHLTVRGLPGDVSRALDAERRRSGRSLNQTVIELLRRALGVVTGRPATNGLERLAGGWSEKDLREFQRATKIFEQVDEDLWR